MCVPVQAVWSPQQDPHPAVLALHHAAALHSAEALPPQQVSPQAVVGPPLQEGNPGEPSLPSPEHLRTQVSQGKPSFAVASPSGTLGHVMLVRTHNPQNVPEGPALQIPDALMYSKLIWYLKSPVAYILGWAQKSACTVA